MIKIIKSDFEGFDDWTHIVEPTRFPDGTSQLWKLPEFCFYEMFTHIIWDFESELEIMPFLKTVQLLNKKSRVDMITIPFMPYSRQDKEVTKVNAEQEVGIAQANALGNASVKVIANPGSASEGLNSVGELFTSKGGTKLGAMIEGLSATEAGDKVLESFGLK